MDELSEKVDRILFDGSSYRRETLLRVRRSVSGDDSTEAELIRALVDEILRLDAGGPSAVALRAVEPSDRPHAQEARGGPSAP